MTTHIDISPHLASPVGEGQIPLLLDYQSVIDIQGSQHLPYGGEREGADDDHRSNDDKRSNRASPLQPPPSLPRRQPILTFPKGGNKLLCKSASAPT